jgi:hypothetical protein
MKLNFALRPLVRFLPAFVALLFATNPLAASNNPLKRDVFLTHGSGSSTITSLVENPDGTLSIEADQAGTLSHVGKFTGVFSYLATVDPDTGTTYLNGHGYFQTVNGDQLQVNLMIVEYGLDYPKPYFGVLNVTGGTGRFAGAQGVLAINGIDEESLTDSFELNGELSLVRSK